MLQTGRMTKYLHLLADMIAASLPVTDLALLPSFFLLDVIQAPNNREPPPLHTIHDSHFLGLFSNHPPQVKFYISFFLIVSLEISKGQPNELKQRLFIQSIL